MGRPLPPLDALGHVRMVADDAVRAGLDEGPEGGDHVRRRETGCTPGRSARSTMTTPPIFLSARDLRGSQRDVPAEDARAAC